MRIRRSSFLLCVGLLLGCGSDDVQPAPSIEALYGAAEETVLTPYPSNRYTVSDSTTRTGLRVRVGTTKDLIGFVPETVAELDEMDGFSSTGGVILSFSGPVDARGIATLPDPDDELGPDGQPELKDAKWYMNADSPLILLDVDPKSPDQGTAIGLVNIYYEQAKDDFYVADEFTIIAQSAIPLRPRTRYLMVVTDALRAKDGGTIGRSALSEQLLSGKLDGDYADQVADALEALSDFGVPASRVRLATVFTTTSTLEGALAMASMARASSPKLINDWTVETSVDAAGKMRFRADMETPEYRDPLPDGRWDFDSDGNPIEKEKVGLEVFLSISDANSSEKRIPVIYGHGLAGDKDGTSGTAGRLSELNVAVFSIDSPHHGSRAAAGDSETDAVFKFFGIDTSDSSFVIGRARDNFRQMASDQLELVKLIRSLDELDLLPPGNPDGIPDLDTSRILYIGHSFGSVEGPIVLSLAPEITHATWNVGGAGLMTLLRDSGLFQLLVNALKPPGTSDGAVSRFFAVTQAIVDPGDPLNYARYCTLEALAGVPDWKPREILLQEVIGDGIVPNSTSAAVARAAGLQLIDEIEPISGLESVPGPVTANISTGVTGAISQFDKIEGDKLATHGELIFSPEGRAQYVEFFKTGLANEHATIPSPY